MAHYILLMKLSPAGREGLLNDADVLVRAHAEVDADEVTGLGLYAVLGAYDIVGIIEAPSNEAAARYSLQLGVMVGASIETLPAVPLTMLEGREGDIDPFLLEGAEFGGPDEEP